MTQKLTLDTMQMVREIRDQINAETKDMSSDEFLAYIHREAAAAEARMRNLAPNDGAGAHLASDH